MSFSHLRRAGTLVLFLLLVAVAPAPSWGERTRVELTSPRPAQALALLNALGASVEVQSADRIQAQVSRRGLPSLTSARGLVRIEPEALVVPLQIVTPVALIGADTWQANGLTGHGVRVAVLDTGFAGYEEAQGTSLPSSVVTRSFRADRSMSGAGDHGRRAAEVVAGVAPGATLYLVSFSTVTELSAAVDYLIAQQVDVVSFSFGYVHNGPGDGTGPVDRIVSRATSAGVMWVAASGNWAQQHWAGTFRDDNRDGVHEFRPGVQNLTHEFNAGDLILVSLRWDEQFGAACTDYDLELFGPGGALVRASRGIQECSGDPVESISILATETGTYSARVVRTSNSDPRRLDVLFLGSPDRGAPVSVAVPQGSVSVPADHPAVVTVGALTSALVRSEAAYSSRGPTADGRSKPNILAPTALGNVAGGAFSGTSAAAPHVAGALALLAEAMPGVDRERLKNELYARAAGVPAVLDASGARRLDLGSLNGLGPLMPTNVDGAYVEGTPPAGGGIWQITYRGPKDYPIRFLYRLLGGRDVAEAWTRDADGRWRGYVDDAPIWANTVDRVSDGATLLIRTTQ